MKVKWTKNLLSFLISVTENLVKIIFYSNSIFNKSVILISRNLFNSEIIIEQQV